MSSFVLAIPDIAQKGEKAYAFLITPQWLLESLEGTGFGAPEVPEGTSEAEASGTLEVTARKMGEDFLTEGRAQATLRVPCARCNEAIDWPVDAYFTQLFVPRGKYAEQHDLEEIELSPEDLDRETYVGDTIELDAIVREHLILEVPMTPRCPGACADPGDRRVSGSSAPREGRPSGGAHGPEEQARRRGGPFVTFRLDGKIALVTGGSRGIGRACSESLAKAGATVVMAYRGNAEAAQEAVSAIEAAGGRAEAVQLDVSSAEAVDSVVKELTKRHGRLDILVNNAGLARDQLLLRVKQSEIDETFGTNVAGAIWCAKAAIRPMMRAKTGRIINLSSVVGETGNPGQAVYSASKAAILGLTKTLAREYASRGITVNAVAPGYIDTDMTSSLSDEIKEGIVSSTPLGRVGRPEEVAAAVHFLASDEAAYITGQVLRVNGGMYV